MIVAAEPSHSELPMEAKRLTGPLFWLHGSESQERLEQYVQKTAESGNGSFTAESRPHRDWLGEGWYRDLAISLEAAKRHDLEMWIFDEKWWPSGEVGGQVPGIHASKYLRAEVVEVKDKPAPPPGPRADRTFMHSPSPDINGGRRALVGDRGPVSAGVRHRL